jgi:serine/threonine protein kinase
MIDLIVGFHHLHYNNIYHRDIKPENIMIEKKNNIFVAKYIDFGFSCTQNILCNKQKIAGTPYFISPEMVTNFNTKEIEHHDMWALAITIMYMFTKKYMISSRSRDLAHELAKFGGNHYSIRQRINNNFSELKKYYPEYEKLINNIIQFIEMMTCVPANTRTIPTEESINILIVDEFNSIKDKQQSHTLLQPPQQIQLQPPQQIQLQPPQQIQLQPLQMQK